MNQSLNSQIERSHKRILLLSIKKSTIQTNKKGNITNMEGQTINKEVKITTQGVKEEDTINSIIIMKVLVILEATTTAKEVNIRNQTTNLTVIRTMTTLNNKNNLKNTNKEVEAEEEEEEVATEVVTISKEELMTVIHNTILTLILKVSLEL